MTALSPRRAGAQTARPPVAPDLAVAWVAGAMVDTLFTTSLVDLFRHPRTAARIGAHLPYASGPHLAVARTNVARMFLESGLPWLLHLDSDMTFTPADVLTLLDAADPVAAPVLGGVYVGAVPAANVAPILEPARLTPEGIVPLSSPPKGVSAVDFCGTGFLLVHRRVYEALEARHPGPLPWYAEAVINGEPVGEDWEFCHRVRKAGLPVQVHGGVRVGHCKRVPLMPPER